jgi:hypothetical protein
MCSTTEGGAPLVQLLRLPKAKAEAYLRMKEDGGGQGCGELVEGPQDG